MKTDTLATSGTQRRIRSGRWAALDFMSSHRGLIFQLTRREIAVLETLMRNRTRPVAKRTLEEAVYSFAEDVSPNAIEAADI